MESESQTTRGGWEPRALVGAVPGHRCQREGGEPGEAGVVAGAVLSSHGPAETASVAAANDEYHMLGSWYYKISYVTTAYEWNNSFLSSELDIYAHAYFLKASTWAVMF